MKTEQRKNNLGLTGKRVNQPLGALRDTMGHIFPVVRGTEGWPIPLLDMPPIMLFRTDKSKSDLDVVYAKMRQRQKHVAYAFNYNPDNLNHKEIK